jgi:alpha,alpha-trehalose phosphorylase
LFIDLDNTHHNTVDGVHIASTGGIWSSLVCGFAGMRDQGQVPHFDPRLPAEWDSLSFRLKIRGRLLSVELRPATISLALVPDSGSPGLGSDAGSAPLEVSVRGERLVVGVETVTVPLDEVPVPAPSVFPSLFPTAGLPVIGSARV